MVYGRTCEAQRADAGDQRGRGQRAGGDAGGSVQTSLWVRDTGVADVLAKLPGPAGGADTLRRYTAKETPYSVYRSLPMCCSQTFCLAKVIFEDAFGVDRGRRVQTHNLSS